MQLLCAGSRCQVLLVVAPTVIRYSPSGRVEEKMLPEVFELSDLVMLPSGATNVTAILDATTEALSF